MSGFDAVKVADRETRKVFGKPVSSHSQQGAVDFHNGVVAACDLHAPLREALRDTTDQLEAIGGLMDDDAWADMIGLEAGDGMTESIKTQVATNRAALAKLEGRG